MDDALLVRRGERVGERGGDLDEPGDRQGTLGDEKVERLALDQLHRQEVDAAGLLDRVDRDDVRVIERGDGAGLALEPLQPLRARGHLGRQHFESDVAAEPRVPRAVDLAHPARADRRDDLVGAEAGAGRQCHRAAQRLQRESRPGGRWGGECHFAPRELLEPRVPAKRVEIGVDPRATPARGCTESSTKARARRAPSRARPRACRSARAGADSTGRRTRHFATGTSAAPRSPSRIASSLRPR